MAMSRKHYESIAQALRAERPGLDTQRDVDDTLDDVAKALATVFAADNPRFDRARFLAACKAPLEAGPTTTIRAWTEAEHDDQCANSGCAGYEFHRFTR